MPIEQQQSAATKDQCLNIVVTGAQGFIGRSLIPMLIRRGHAAIPWQRDPVFDLSNDRDHGKWVAALRGVDVVVHLAAHVHQLKVPAADSARAQLINCDGSLRLAAAALEAGVGRFVFISTSKVFGEGGGAPYRADSPADPHDAYARSKWAAEQQLRALVAGTALQLVVIRPPLVYGPGAGANFARLRQLADLPLPLPIQSIHNRRDMIGIDNLIDLIALCIHAPAAAGGTWLCSDGAAYSLADVVRNLRRARGRRPLLFPLPAAPLIRIAALLLGRAAAQRLFGNFELDISATRTALNWTPPLSMQAIMRNHPEPRA